MVYLKLLPKIWYKPREAFEELKGNTNAEDGVITLIIYSLFSLVLFGIFARAFGINVILVQFGFGYVLNLKNVLIFFTMQFFGLIFVSLLVNWAAIKLGGDGYFQETFSFYCYGKSLNLVQAIVSVGGVLWMNVQILKTIAALNQGIVLEQTYLVQFTKATGVAAVIFAIWLIYILTEGVSVAHNLSRLRGFAALMFANLIVSVFSFLINTFIIPLYL